MYLLVQFFGISHEFTFRDVSFPGVRLDRYIFPFCFPGCAGTGTIPLNPSLYLSVIYLFSFPAEITTRWGVITAGLILFTSAPESISREPVVFGAFAGVHGFPSNAFFLKADL